MALRAELAMKNQNNLGQWVRRIFKKDSIDFEEEVDQDLVTDENCRSHTYTVTLYDEDMHVIRTFTKCMGAETINNGVQFEDEFGLLKYFEAPWISIEEQP
jgi:hypothetical protein